MMEKYMVQISQVTQVLQAVPEVALPTLLVGSVVGIGKDYVHDAHGGGGALGASVYQVGEQVSVRASDGVWHHAHVTAVDRDGACDIKYIGQSGGVKHLPLHDQPARMKK